MCEYNSLEELMELSIEDIEKHISTCNDCRNKYSDLLKILYPDIKLNIKKRKSSLFSFKKLSFIIGFAIIILVLSIGFINNKQSLDYTYLLNEDDISQAVDNLDEDQFIELFYTLKEDL